MAFALLSRSRSKAQGPVKPVSKRKFGGMQPLHGNHPVLQTQDFGRPLAPAVPLLPGQNGILQRKCACGSSAGMSGACEECSKKQRLGLQTKLKVNEPGDSYEQEADRIVDQVMAAPAHHAMSGTSPRIQRFSRQSNGPMDAAPASVDQALGSPGRPLEPALQQDMEQRFGYDFSRVRVHTGGAADESAWDVNAHAYTVGHNIVFGAGRFAPGTHQGRRLLAHELTHVVQQSGGGDIGPSRRVPVAPVPAAVQRKCQDQLGAPTPACTPGLADDVGTGWQFFFKMGCDELLPGQDSKITKIKYGWKLRIHGFASSEGDPDFNKSLSCHRANAIARLAATRRPECPIVGRYMHGTPKVPGAREDPNVWRSVVVEEIRPTAQEWLDPNSILSKGQALYNRAQALHATQADRDAAGAHRALLKSWLENTPKTLAPPGRELDQQDLSDYRQFYTSVVSLWKDIDILMGGPMQTSGLTYAEWTGGKKILSGQPIHATHVPKGARYHVDLFGEGYYPGAVNIGAAWRTTTTLETGAPVPNLIYRMFSAKNAALNHLPIADHVVDLVTAESGPIANPGLIDEIARIIAAGGTIVLYGTLVEQYCDQMREKVGGTMKTDKGECVVTAELP
jgi:hypothetical protein